MKKCVAVIFGGQSSEHKVSLQSSINIIKAIDRKKYNLILIGIDKNGRWILCQENNYVSNINDFSNIHLIPNKNYLALIPGHNKKKFFVTSTGYILPHIDIVFSVLHGAYGENGTIQGLMEMLNIPFVGSKILGSAICMNKDITKIILNHAGISVAPSLTLFHDSSHDTLNFNYIKKLLGSPLFIKPTNQGSSIGISKVNNQNSFDDAVKLAFHYSKKVLVEKAISGRQIEIALLGNNNNPKLSTCGEIIVNNDFYTYENKYLNNKKTKLIIPVKFDAFLTKKIHKIACKSYFALNCNIMARIDLFLTPDKKIIVNEVNTLPGFSNISMYPKLWESCGLNYFNLINYLISITLKES